MALPLQLTALPRLSQDREVGLQRMMAQLSGASDEGALRPGNLKDVAIEVEVIPIFSSAEYGGGRGSTHFRGVRRDPGPFHITLCVDANGRVSQRGATE